MNKYIVITSDIHGDYSTFNLVKLKEYYESYYWDLGDSEMTDEELWPFLSVKGNCDRFPFPLHEIIKVDDEVFYLSHHPLSEKEMLKLHEKEGVTVFLHGHLHVREERKLDGFLVLSPGSLSFPRDGQAGYLKLTVDKTLKNIEFIDI